MILRPDLETLGSRTPLIGRTARWTYLERWGDLVRAFAARLHSIGRAADLVQAMYERILVVPPQEEIASPLAYLYRLGSNLLLDDLRQRRRQDVRERPWSDCRGSR